MLVRRIKTILQTGGVPYLLKRTCIFIADFCCQYGRFYVYNHTPMERNESDFVPKIGELAFYIVSTPQEAEELATKGFDFRPYSLYSIRRLKKGAIAFCFFSGHDLAHIGWVALSKEAKDAFDPHPYPVDFTNREACTGGSFTIPKYERQGLMTYGYYKRLEYLRERGIAKSKNTVNVNNIASQKANDKFPPGIVARAFYLRIFRWHYWKQTHYSPG